MGKLRVITDRTDLKNKTILLRADLDVEINNGHIIDDTRLLSCLETINYIIKHGGNVIIMGHMGRPTSDSDIKLSLLPVAKWFTKKNTNPELIEIKGFHGFIINDHITLLENIRFFKEEKKNDKEFCEKLAGLADIYVNESFATSHRCHASMCGITKLLPSYAGIHLEKEVQTLTNVMKNPKRPLVVLIGGAKLETKLPMVEKMHHIADYVLVGGKIAEEQKTLIRVQHEKIPGKKSVVLVADNTPNGLDITEKDTENFIQILELAKTIVWNGPVGKMGDPKTEKNTLSIAYAIKKSDAFSIVGGGDSLALLKTHALLDSFSFVSTGGGAMLEFLSGKKLPALEALQG